ncbi:TIGD1 protein, partial [Crocuta crocuta]
PGSEAEKDRPTLLFCANAVRFMIRTAFIYMAPCREKISISCQPFGCTRRPRQQELFSLDWFHQCFVPEIRKFFPMKVLPFTVILILDKAPSHPEPYKFNTKGIKGFYLCSNTTSIIQPQDREVIRTFKAHYM